MTLADTRIEELRRRLERDPGSRLFAQLAEEHRKAGEHAEAIRVARAGLAQHPSYPSARLTLGRALLDSGDAGQARVELEAALRDAPDNILASRFLGQALESLGELGPALVQLERTLKMAPGDRQLESQIASLQARLRSPQALPPASAAIPPPSAASRSEVTAPFPGRAAPANPAAGTADDGDLIPPTIRIHRPGDRAARLHPSPLPPPLPPNAAPPVAAAPSVQPPLPPPVATRAQAPIVPVPPAAPAPAAPAPAGAPASGTAPPSRPRVSAEPFYESDVALTLPTSTPLEVRPADDTVVPTLPPGAVAADETVFEAEAAPERTAPFSSSTLAELYFRQGLVDRAVEVYRQVLDEEPGNERARSRLAELETVSLPVDARAARRAALERTIAGLEALLVVLQRR